MKIRIKSFLVSGILIISMTNCKDYLEVNPKGLITEEQLAKPEYTDGLVTAAYAYAPRVGAFDTMNPWIASLRSDDAYKGGGGLDDQSAWYQMEVFTLVNANVGNNDGVWFQAYSAISRMNTAINAINRMDEADYPAKTARLGEMRFLLKPSRMPILPQMSSRISA